MVCYYRYPQWNAEAHLSSHWIGPSPLQSRSYVAAALRLCLFVGFPLSSPAQSTPPAPAISQTPATPAATAPTINYPNTESGLDHLAKDIVNAVKEGNANHAIALTQSMVLPDPAAWYHQTFGEYSGGKEIVAYTNQRLQLPLEILGLFKRAIQDGNTSIRVKRFDADCDDNDGENTFATLDARITPTAFYDLRLYKGVSHFRLWPLAYVDGTFRYVAEPHPWDYFPSTRLAQALPAPGTAPAGGEDANNSSEAPSRIRKGGNVIAAKLIKRVTPQYPEAARSECLEGTVRLNAVIGKDGSIIRLRVMTGYCSLARASLEGVKNWRYTPTLFQGNPVEVDTIDVIFAMGH